MINGIACVFSWLVGFAVGALAVCVVWARSLRRNGAYRPPYRDVPPPKDVA